MSKSESHPIRNGLIVAIVGGVALSFWNPARKFILILLKCVWSAVVYLWKLLCGSYSVSGWLILLLLLLSIPTIIFTIFKLWTREQPEFKNYVQDTIYGALWRWSWSGESIHSLWCFCPVCDCELVCDDSSCRSLYDKSHTDFLCERCGSKRVASIPGGNLSYATSAVEREIRRKIRTEEYKDVLTKRST